MSNDFHRRVVGGVWQVLRLPCPADRADGIEKPEKFDFDILAEGLLETLGDSQAKGTSSSFP
jgi:hypothetical protein